MASVKVAVRVRPFDTRERNLNDECNIEITGGKLRLYPPKVVNYASTYRREQIKEFAYDYSYWSHDNSSNHFASQETVYKDLGETVVQNILDGYNACVFAYGQTGSGKTYTMMGSQNGPDGLIPRICEALFTRIDEGRETGATYKVQVSFLEIYNEKVRDLLVHNLKKSSLRVREDAGHRPFVENLSQHTVTTFSEIQKLIERGNIQRTTASTKMNETSSRSHCIFTVTFIQAKLVNDTPVETSSKINLVDLAGSERASVSGDSFTEGSHINKSLVTLGLVISNLSERLKMENTGKTVHIPYRNSVLTWLLKDSLGGNSKTIMIATISPAAVNYSETLSTLRYASRAKNIINKPVINEDPKTKLIRQLREEIQRLLLLQEKDNSEKGTCDKDESILEELIDKQAKEKELTNEWTEKWRQTREILQEQTTLGLKKTGESGHGVTLYSDRPHVVVVDNKVFPGGVSVFILKEGTNSVGTSETQDIRLEGLGILDEHCVITSLEECAFLEPKIGAEIYLDGDDIKEKTLLRHGHTLLLGANNVIRYNDPVNAPLVAKLKLNHPSKKNLRDSFLSRSMMDLFLSQDDICSKCAGSPMRSGRRFDDSSYVKHPNSQYCEMATQTSSNSEPNSFVNSKHMFPPERNTSLPLLEGNNGNSCDVESLHSGCSSPAFDTFYTATSDPSDLMSSVHDLPSPDPPVYSELLQHIRAPGGVFTSTPSKRSETKVESLPHTVRMADSQPTTSEIPDLARSFLTKLADENPNESGDERSEYLSYDKELSEVLRVMDNQKLPEDSLKQTKEYRKLVDHYTRLEDGIADDGCEKENLPLQPNDVFFAARLLKEGRIALLIEREIQRRVSEEVKKRQNAEGRNDTSSSQMKEGLDPLSSSDVGSTSIMSDEECDGASSSPRLSFPNEAESSSVSEVNCYDIARGIRASIPSYELRGGSSGAHWQYEVRLVAGKDEWTVFRRYRRFRELHIYLCNKFGPIIEEIPFPPRRIFGNYSERIVEGRRRHLETYLRRLLVICCDLEGSPLCDVEPSKPVLCSLSPFFQRGVFEVGPHSTT